MNSRVDWMFSFISCTVFNYVVEVLLKVWFRIATKPSWRIQCCFVW